MMAERLPGVTFFSHQLSVICIYMQFPRKKIRYQFQINFYWWKNGTVFQRLVICPAFFIVQLFKHLIYFMLLFCWGSLRYQEKAQSLRQPPQLALEMSLLNVPNKRQHYFVSGEVAYFPCTCSSGRSFARHIQHVQLCGLQEWMCVIFISRKHYIYLVSSELKQLTYSLHLIIAGHLAS